MMDERSIQLLFSRSLMFCLDLCQLFNIEYKPPPLSAWLFIVRPRIIFFVVSCHLFTIESTLWPLSALSVRWFCLLV